MRLGFAHEALGLETREERKPNQLRRDGKIPATVYGPGSPSINVQVNEREFTRLPLILIVVDELAELGARYGIEAERDLAPTM